MEKFINILFKIDGFLSNYPAQLVLLCLGLWAFQLQDSLISIWVAIGFLLYVFFISINLFIV